MRRFCRFLPFRIGALFAFLALSLASSWAMAGQTYYVSSQGDDGRSGHGPDQAWRTLERVADAALEPGDQVLLRAGDRFTGMLELRARGTADAPIVVGRFGEGNRPILDGQGREASLMLVNPEHLVVRGLELTNPAGRYGVRMVARDAGALGQVLLEDLHIHRVYDEAWQAGVDPGHDQRKYYGGINAQVMRGQRPSWWESLVIRDCLIHDLGTCGISIGSDYPLHERRRASRRADAYPILGVLIERNVIRDIARDGAIVRQAAGAVMQHNEVARTGKVSISNGIWYWDCQQSVIRYNVGSECGARGDVDGGPFSVDYYCHDCVIEYNYSYNNEGPGFMAFGNDQTGKGTVIRGNVSYNDATVQLQSGFAAASFISTISEAVMEGNVVIAGPDTTALLGHVQWQGLPLDVLYRGNLFVGNGRAEVQRNVMGAARFEGNLFLNVPHLPTELESEPEAAGRAFVEAMARARQVRDQAGRQ